MLGLGGNLIYTHAPPQKRYISIYQVMFGFDNIWHMPIWIGCLLDGNLVPGKPGKTSCDQDIYCTLVAMARRTVQTRQKCLLAKAISNACSNPWCRWTPVLQQVCQCLFEIFHGTIQNRVTVRQGGPPFDVTKFFLREPAAKLRCKFLFWFWGCPRRSGVCTNQQYMPMGRLLITQKRQGNLKQRIQKWWNARCHVVECINPQIPIPKSG